MSKLSIFYTYTLTDPRTGQTFYVGKGQNGRMYQHVRDVNRGKVSNQAKTARIRAIHAAGLLVEHRVVDRFTDETAAYAAEVMLIAQHIGLTNCTKGGGSLSKPRTSDLDVALTLKGRLRNFCDWVSVPNRTAAEIAMYNFVADSLDQVIALASRKAGAKCVQP